MSVTGFIKGYWWRLARRWLEWRVSRRPAKIDLQRSNWDLSLRDPTAFYFECLRCYHQELPPELRAHRAYFYNVASNRRGFGENAFHSLWHLLIKEFKPANFLEIGVFRGQTVSLVALCARLNGARCDVYGISPFVPAGDAAIFYRSNIDYHADTLSNFDHFGLPHPKLVRAYSSDPPALELIASKSWDLIYIDGGHEYEVARQDWDACSRSLRPGGIIVMDDASLTTAFNPPAFAASRGLPGPTRVADEIDRHHFREILQVGHNRVFQKLLT